MSVPLTQEQTNQLPFPIGCPVWFFPGDDPPNGNSYTIQQGSVSRVSLDLQSHELLFEVKNNDKVIADKLTQKELAYAFQCPVTVHPVQGEAGEPFQGVVLQARNVGETMIYTIMYSIGDGYNAYKENIKGERVKYRQVAVRPQENVAGAAREEPAQAPVEQQPPVAEVTVASAAQSCDNHSQVTHESKTAPTAAGSVAGANQQQVLQGATHGYNNLEPSPAATSMERPDMKRIESMAHPDAEDGQSAAKRARTESNASSWHKNPNIKITLPMWLQKDKDMRDRLYGKWF